MDDDTLSAKDASLMAGLLEAVIILWEGSGVIFKVKNLISADKSTMIKVQLRLFPERKRQEENEKTFLLLCQLSY